MLYILLYPKIEDKRENINNGLCSCTILNIKIYIGSSYLGLIFLHLLQLLPHLQVLASWFPMPKNLTLSTSLPIPFLSLALWALCIGHTLESWLSIFLFCLPHHSGLRHPLLQHLVHKKWFVTTTHKSWSSLGLLLSHIPVFKDYYTLFQNLWESC